MKSRLGRRNPVGSRRAAAEQVPHPTQPQQASALGIRNDTFDIEAVLNDVNAAVYRSEIFGEKVL